MLIGVLTAQIDEPYQSTVWRGIETRAREIGAGVICFAGRRIDSPVISEAAANVVYDMADSGNLDGLIIVTTTIATFIDKDKIGRIFSSKNKIPKISVGFKAPGVPSITVDGTGSIAKLVRHLVQDHKRTKIALVGGPLGHPEAEEREKEFRKALGEAGVPFDERLCFQGDFLKFSGSEAAKKLLSSGIPFDTVFCMNDRMAFGVLDTLHEHGVQVPDDVALVGFDGVEESNYKTPPLTTVLQPLDELGSTAIDMLIALIEGKTVMDRVLMCNTLIRQSCACPPVRPYDWNVRNLPASIRSEVCQAIDTLVDLANQGDEEGFIARLNKTLAAEVHRGEDLRQWNDYLTIIKHRVAKFEPKTQDRIQSLFETARVLLGDIESRRQAERRVAAENKLSSLRSVGSSLSGGFEMPVMLNRLKNGLTELGIGEGFLALFDKSEDKPKRSVLMMAPENMIPNLIPSKGIRFFTTGILPPKIDSHWKNKSWILEPLVFQEEALGYMMLPGGFNEPAVYDALAEQVSSALKGTLLLQQVRTHEKRLEEEVARRTAELLHMNKNLIREVDRRRRLEEEVSEISNLTMQRIGQDLHDDICQHLAGISMLSSVLKCRLEESDSKSADAMNQIGELLAESITRTKKIARGLYPTGLSEQGLVAAIKDLIDSARKSFGIPIDFYVSSGFKLDDKAKVLQLYRIIQEALNNAIKHAKSDRIKLSLYHEQDDGGTQAGSSMIIEVSDNGTGLPDAVPERGMGLRIMRYRAETIGAELLIDRLVPGTRIRCRIHEQEA